MNDACSNTIKTKKATGKPDVPKNKTVLGALKFSAFTNINPTSTPVSAYTKKSK